MVHFALKAAAALSSLLAVTNAAAIQARDTPRAFYSIAHRCLSRTDIQNALDDGANAIETDMAAWKEWYADHDVKSDGSSSEAKAEDLFKFMGEHKNKDQIRFVWLDMKNPDWCTDKTKDKCHFSDLHDMVKKYLTGNGIRVMYEFYTDPISTDDVPWKHEKPLKESPAFEYLRKNLGDLEAISIKSSTWKKSSDGFENDYKGHPLRQQLYDNGFDDPKPHLDDLTKDLKGALSKRGTVFNKVFSFTTNEDDESAVNKLMDLEIDGLIYGNREHDYSYDRDGIKKAHKFITNYIGKHKSLRAADKNDNPW